MKLFEYIPKPVISLDNYSSASIENEAFSKKLSIHDENNNVDTLNKNNINNNSDSKTEIEERNKYMKENARKVYAIYNEEKSEAEKALDAYDGLAHLFN